MFARTSLSEHQQKEVTLVVLNQVLCCIVRDTKYKENEGEVQEVFEEVVEVSPAQELEMTDKILEKLDKILGKLN